MRPSWFTTRRDWDRLESGPTVIVGADGRQGARDLRFRTWLRSGTSDVEVRVDLLFEHPSKPRRRVASTPDEVFADAGP